MGSFRPEIKLREYAEALKPKGITSASLETTGGKWLAVIEYGKEGKAVVNCSEATDEAVTIIEQIVREMAMNAC